MSKTIRVPIIANYKTIDGEPVLQSAEYAEVDVRIIADMIAKAFNLQLQSVLVTPNRPNTKEG